MKKRNLFQLFIIMIMMFPIFIQAESFELKLDCPKTASPNQFINCNLSSNQSQYIKGLQLKFSLPQEITYDKLELQKDWTSYYQNKNGLVITKHNSTQLEESIGKISFKINNNIKTNKDYTITLTSIEASNNNHNLLSSPDLTTTIKVLSDDNSLSSLTITNGSLSPKFSKQTQNYTATISKDNTTITAKPTDKNAKVTGDIGYKKLNYGANIFTITVTSPLGNAKKYTIIINRPLPPVNNSSNVSPNKNTNPTPNQKSNTNQTISKSNDASLKKITIKGYYLDFKPDIYNYDLTVSNDITNLDIEAIPNHNQAQVIINKNDTLEIGTNIITITVTAEDGTICHYILNITRKDKQLSNDATIKNLIIENYNLDFNPKNYNYNLTIKDEGKLNIKVILNDSDASYTIKGNNNLSNGKTITIIVTAQDETTKEYKIKISKENNKNISIDSNKNLIIFIIIIVILIIAILSKFLNKNKKSK